LVGNGFKLVHSDRNDGSGVGLYVKSGIAFKVVAKSTPEQPIDYIFADLKICGTRLLVGVIYTPPKIDGYPFYGLILEELTHCDG
jgi:hypothetical protein